MSFLPKLVRFIDIVIPKNQKYIYLKSDFLYPDNIQAILDAILANGIEKDYTVFCDGIGFNCYRSLDKIRFIKRHSIKGFWSFFRSKYVFTDIGINGLKKPVKNQLLINTWHGTSLKKIGYLMNDNLNESHIPMASYVIAYSPFFVNVLSKAFGISKDRVLVTGEPRNDYLFSENDTILKRLNIENNKKILIWMPTYRQNKFDNTDDGAQYELGIPLLSNRNISLLNEHCSNNGCLLIIKWHGMQSNSEIDNKYSNIRFITSEDIQKTELPLYHLIAQCDGLITDYSSIYINYLVLNKPICFAYDDMDQYMQKRGFMFDNVKEIMPGVHAETFEDLLNFIEIFSNGKDNYIEDRLRVNSLLNSYSDNNNANRLLKALDLIK